ncbi:GNAT family N-acetyltransferase [Gracilimonas sp.]|uniref:GNAT family N-acetyltransferase n=1 Tax=Gracilimonas sp. TaxID=1974203 RepID=UPI002870DA5A|nr:GNAT family N-acetyltransferase [Gracilimonas sp.]
MNIIYKGFNELTPGQAEDMFRLRQQVFIIEQTCLYEDIDGYDAKAGHLFFYDEEVLAAYLRIFKPGDKYKEEASLGRIIVSPKYRGTGLGPKLVKKGIELCIGETVKIEAQAALQYYYESLGFKVVSDVYVVDDIDHIEMVLEK